MQKVRPRLTYANVVATLALFLALAGGAAIAATAKKNSVTTKSIKNRNVTASDLAGTHIVTGPTAGASTAVCPPGERLVGGGYRIAEPRGLVPAAAVSVPQESSWFADAASGNLSAYALCLKSSPGS